MEKKEFIQQAAIAIYSQNIKLPPHMVWEEAEKLYYAGSRFFQEEKKVMPSVVHTDLMGLPF